MTTKDDHLQKVISLYNLVDAQVASNNQVIYYIEAINMLCDNDKMLQKKDALKCTDIQCDILTKQNFAIIDVLMKINRQIYFYKNKGVK